MGNIKIRAGHIVKGDVVSGQGQVVRVEQITDVFENIETGEIIGSKGVALQFISTVTGEPVFLRMPEHVMVDMISTVRRGTDG